MKIRRLNEDAKRFYVDEIVSAPGGKTETERHSFATIDELKKYCKDANLTKHDIANCGGCDIKDLCEDVDKHTPDSRVKLEVKYEVYGRYGTGGQVKKGRVSGVDEVDALMNMLDHVNMYMDSDFADEFEEETGTRPTTEDVVERLYSENGDGCDLIYYITNLTTGNMIFDGGVVEEEEDWDNLDESTDSKLYTKPNGEYLVKADSGKGYTAFSRDNVAIGGIDNEDADSDNKAIAKFKRNEYSECLNEAYFDTPEYRILKYEEDIPELMAGMHDDYMGGRLAAEFYAKALEQVYNALAECDYKHTMSEPVVTNGSGKRVLDALAKLDKTNEALGIGAGLALGGAAIGAGMIGSSLLDSVEDKNKEEETELNELFDIEIDAKGFGGSGNNVHVGPGSMPLTASVEENEDDTALNEGSEKYYAAKYTAVDNSGNKTVKKICFRCDGTIEDAEKEVDALIKEPYTELKVIGSCLKGVAEKDGYKLIESVEYDEDDPDTWPWKEMVEYKLDDPYGEFLDDLYSEFVEDAYKLVEAEGFTDVFTEPSTQCGRGADFFWAKKNGVDYRGHYDFETLNDGFGDCCLEANSREEALAACAKYYANIIINNLRPEEDEDFEYDDEYSDDYTESLDECSGIKAHKVIMGEGIDDIGIDGDLSEEDPTGDKTEDIEFVMEEYIAESLLIDFVEKIDALTYKVGANDQVVTVVFDPKWSEYVYTIDGKGPYSHSSYEFISRDIYDFVMSQISEEHQYDDLID